MKYNCKECGQEAYCRNSYPLCRECASKLITPEMIEEAKNNPQELNF